MWILYTPKLQITIILSFILFKPFHITAVILAIHNSIGKGSFTIPIVVTYRVCPALILEFHSLNVLGNFDIHAKTETVHVDEFWNFMTTMDLLYSHNFIKMRSCHLGHRPWKGTWGGLLSLLFTASQGSKMAVAGVRKKHCSISGGSSS